MSICCICLPQPSCKYIIPVFLWNYLFHSQFMRLSRTNLFSATRLGMGTRFGQSEHIDPGWRAWFKDWHATQAWLLFYVHWKHQQREVVFTLELLRFYTLSLQHVEIFSEENLPANKANTEESRPKIGRKQIFLSTFKSLDSAMPEAMLSPRLFSYVSQ